MSNLLPLNGSYPLVGPGTLTYTIPVTGLYNVHVDLTEIPPSGISVVVNNNASPVYTADALTPTQSAQQFKYSFSAVAADVITVVLASSAAGDNLLNTVKSITSIGQGV